jgi:hypothetical protein
MINEFKNFSHNLIFKWKTINQERFLFNQHSFISTTKFNNLQKNRYQINPSNNSKCWFQHVNVISTVLSTNVATIKSKTSFEPWANNCLVPNSFSCLQLYNCSTLNLINCLIHLKTVKSNNPSMQPST